MKPLLGPADPDPVLIERAASTSAFVITCDHAGKAIPQALGDLGISSAELDRHIGWDIGALGTARHLAALLDAPLIAQRYSRLVIDCNRPPGHAGLITPISDGTRIPANRSPSDADIRQRTTEIYDPYHAALAAILDERKSLDIPITVVSMHSFTPIFEGFQRPWHIGVLSGADRRVADPVLAALSDQTNVCVGDNQPYQIDEKDAGIPRHAINRGLPNVLFEIRQDLIESSDGQQNWAGRVARALESL